MTVSVSYRWWALCLACGAAGPVACGDDDVSEPGPPEIVALRMLDGCTVEVTFSEGMDSAQGVDPDVFRLSAAFYADGVTTYYDLGIHFNGSPDGTESPPKTIPDDTGGDGRVPRHFVSQFIDLERDEDDATVYRLVNNLDVTERGACEAVAAAPSGRLLLHYSDFWEPRVTDRSGDPLGDLGSHWVRSLGMKTEEGRFPFMPNDLPIPCPEGDGAAHF